MSNYRCGSSFERRLRKYLEDAGFFVVRAAQSRGLTDLIAVKAPEATVASPASPDPVSVARLYSCRIHGRWSGQEKQDLYALAKQTNSTAYLVSRGAACTHYMLIIERLEAAQ